MRTIASDSRSHIRETHRSRQTQSGHSPSTHPLLENDLPEPSPKIRKAHNTSIPETHKISFNLVSLVTKFEALDALSLPFKVPALQPAPLQVSPRVRRRGGGTTAGQFRKLTAIFSPGRSVADCEDPFFSEHDTPPRRDNLFSSSKSRILGSLESKAGTGRLKKAQNTYNGSKIKARNIDIEEDTPRSDITAPYVKNEFSAKNKHNIRDMVRLYDGAISDGTVTKGKPSTNGSWTPNTPTPLSRKIPSESRYHLSPSTGNSRRKPCPWNGKEPDSPRRVRQSSSKRGLLLENVAANQFMGQVSPSKSSISSVQRSIRIFDRGRDEGQTFSIKASHSPRGDKYDQDTVQGLHRTPTKKQAIVWQEGERGRSLPRKEITAIVDRRKISDKIERLYRAKSLERKQDTVQGQDARTSILTKAAESHGKGIGNAPSHSDFGRYIKKKSSKVAAMTKLFDKDSPPRPSVKAAPVHQSKPVFSTSPPFVRQSKSPVVRAISAPTLPPLPPWAVTRKFSISPKTVQKPAMVYETSNSSIRPRTDAAFQPTVLQKKSPQLKSHRINEKMKLFETVRDGKEAVPKSKRTGFAKKLSRSLKGFFEQPSLRRSEEAVKQAGKENSLSGREVQDIVDDVQSGGKLVQIGKRKSIFDGRWNIMAAAPVSNGADGTFGAKSVGSPMAAEVQKMVVKEAECGLKEPKPVRVVEVKRMMLLCKERFGDMIDKEKGHTRRL